MLIKKEPNNIIKDYNNTIRQDNILDNIIKNIKLMIILKNPSLYSQKTPYYNYKTLLNYGK